MTKIEMLIELCGCNVEFDVARHDKRDNVACVGRYSWAVGSLSCNISVSHTKSEAAKLATLAHETGHALCDANGCACKVDVIAKKGTTAESERHAIKFTMQWLLDNKCKDAMIWQIKMVEQEADGPCHAVHTEAYQDTMKLKLWEKCKKFAKSGE